MRAIIIGFLSLLTVASEACVTAPDAAWSVSRIDATRGMLVDDDFQFTVSPNDRWIVFLAREREPSEDVDYRYGDLRVLDQKTNSIRSFIFSEAKAPTPFTDSPGPLSSSGFWALDSSHCLLRPPNVQSQPFEFQSLLIRVNDGTGEVQSQSVLVRSGVKPEVVVPGEEYRLAEPYTCSDCSPHFHDLELIRKHVDRKYVSLQGHERSGFSDPSVRQIVSPDGTKIYFQKGPELGVHSEQTTLFELDIATGKERELVTHVGACALLNRLRPSPDGKKLAYQVSGFCIPVPPNRLFILDLESLVETEIDKRPAYGMHWNSASDKLYFASEGYLHVAQFDAPKQ